MSELPVGWVETTLGSVAEIKLGKMLDQEKNQGEPTEYLRNVNVRWGRIDTADVLQMRMTASDRASLDIRNGDIMVCEGGEPGRSAVWDIGPTKLSFQKALMRMRPVQGISPHLVAFNLRQMSVAGTLEAHFTGTTIKHLPQQALSRVPIALPPLPEQRRIVAKIDGLSGKSKRARDHLDHVPRLVEKYKQAVLGAAFNGDLTREWRSLQKLRVPWQETTLGAVLSDMRYGTAKKCDYDGGAVAVLRIPNVQNGTIDLHDLKYADFSDKELEKLRLRIGDVLVIRSNGSVGLVGRSAVVAESAVGMLFAGYLIRLRLNQLVVPAFVHLRLQAPDMRALIEQTAKSTSGVNNINSEELKGLPLLRPNIDEQHEIVRRIEHAFTWIDRLATEATSARKLVDRLDQAILAKAFRGELVSQDPNDEPASVLLDRIRSERASTAAAKPKHKAKK